MKHVPLHIDLAFCLLFLPLMLFVFPVERWWVNYPWFFGSFAVWLYITYFAYRYLIVPYLFHVRRERIAALLLILLSLAVTQLFASYEIHSPFYQLRQLQEEPAVHLSGWGIRQNRQAVWLHYIVVVIFCFAVGMLTEAYRQRLAHERTAAERDRAELALYKAQINPHFLFNTLNSIYGLLITGSERTAPALERFIDLTKYMYHNAGHDYIALCEEIEYIGQYIELQRLRLNDFAEVRFTHEAENRAMPVPPMLLITFVENAFKYGISSNEPCFIRIALRQQANRLCFEVENSVFGTENGEDRGPEAGQEHETEAGRSGGTEAGRGGESADGRSHETESGRNHGTETGQSHRTEAGWSHETESGRNHGTETGRSHRTEAGWSHETESGRNHGTETGRSHRTEAGGGANARRGRGMGLANCRKRLALLYPDRHRLLVEEQKGVFRVRLELQNT